MKHSWLPFVLHDCYLIIRCNLLFIRCISFTLKFSCLTFPYSITRCCTLPYLLTLILFFLLLHCLLCMYKCMCVCLLCVYVYVYVQVRHPRPHPVTAPHTAAYQALPALYPTRTHGMHVNSRNSSDMSSQLKS